VRGGLALRLGPVRFAIPGFFTTETQRNG